MTIHILAGSPAAVNNFMTGGGVFLVAAFAIIMLYLGRRS